MFSQATVIINRPVEEVYSFLSTLRKQLECWEMINVPDIKTMEDSALSAPGTYRLAGSIIDCHVSLHHTRPGSGLVTRISWISGELAAEWRIIEDKHRTKVELNLEGAGGGLASEVRLIPLARRIASRLKQKLEMA